MYVIVRPARVYMRAAAIPRDRRKVRVDAGADGVVCSPREASAVRAAIGAGPLIVTPGIRPGANILEERDDQKRIVTARRAVADGADYVVVGRPISKAAEPLAVIAALQAEIRKALET